MTHHEPPTTYLLWVHRTQVVLDHLGRDRASQHVAAVLIEAPVNAAIHACIIHVIGDRSVVSSAWYDGAGRDPSAGTLFVIVMS